MRFRHIIAGLCLLFLLSYFSLYYYEIVAAPQWYLQDTFSPIDYPSYPSPHMNMARDSHFLPPVECGRGWQEKYGEFHGKTLKENGKVLVSVAIEGGLADNLSGLMSEFYLALLSNRALQIYEFGYLPKYEPAFDYVYFNWSNPGTYPDILTNNLRYTINGQRNWQGDRSYPPEVNTTENWYIYQMNDQYLEKDWMFGQADLTREVPRNKTGAKNLFMVSNRGMTYRLAHNPHHKETFAQMGIKPELMFGCAFRAIFKPTNALVKRTEQYLQVLTNPKFKKIGIMVRTGDGSFNEGKLSDESFNRFKDYFQCAEEIEALIRKNGHTEPIIWYLLSDSLAFRRKAKVKYGSKILTDVETNFIHPDCVAHDASLCSHELSEVAMMQAAGQMITFAWTDYQVITRNSGFGRAGAVLSNRNNSIYSMPREFKPCDAEHYDTWDHISQDWAGI